MVLKQTKEYLVDALEVVAKEVETTSAKLIRFLSLQNDAVEGLGLELDAVRERLALAKAQNAAMVQQYMELNIESFHQDVAVWNNKCIIDNPLMCDGDGPIHLVRKWYSQFMTDVADIREDQVRAREHVTVDGPTVAEVRARSAT